MANAKFKDELVVLQAFLRSHANIRLSLDNMQKPSAQWLTHVYMWFIHQITEYPMQGMWQRTAFTCSNTKNPELHDMSFSLLSVCLAVDNILDDTGFTDGFFFRDLLNPKCIRTFRILHHLMTVCVDRWSRREKVEEIRGNAIAAREDCGRLEVENEQMRERIVAARIRLAECQPVLKQLKEDDERWAAELQMKREDATSLDKESKQLEQETESEKSAYENVCGKIQRLNEESLQLDSQLVSSPEKLMKELEDLEETKEDVAKCVKAAKDKAAESNERKMHLMLAGSKLDFVQNSLKQLLEEKDKLDVVQENHQKLVEKRQGMHSVVETSIRKVETKRNTVKTKETQSKSLKQQKEARVKETRQELDRLRQDLDRVVREGRVDSVATANLTKSMQEKQNHFKTVESEHMMVKESIHQAFSDLKEQLEYHKNSARQFFKAVVDEINSAEQK